MKRLSEHFFRFPAGAGARTLALCLVVCAGIFLAGCAENGEVIDDLGDARKAMTKRDFLEAEKSFERYLRHSPQGAERWEVWNSLVELALSVRNDRKFAIELLETMRVEYDGDPVRQRFIGMRLAEQYRLSGKYDRAVSLWSAVAEDKTANSAERAEACRHLAHVYLRRLEFELAKESLNYCLALDVPDAVRAECLYDLAQTHMGMDEMPSAVKEFREVLKLRDILQPTRTLATFMLADALDQLGKSAEALELFESISETYPNRKVMEQRIDLLRKKRNKSSPVIGKWS